MRDPLAERLLTRVMGWNQTDVKNEQPLLQAMARYKYDSYQQFFPGMRFEESLALWLNQFREPEERKVAYTFVKEKLIFFSEEEINHLIGTVYPDFIRPELIKDSAKDIGAKPWQISKIVNSPQFQARQRQCLFLGLSDGARTDIFRRHTGLSNEQVRLSYEVDEERVSEMLQALKKDLACICGEKIEAEPKFRTIVLLDDFSASGISYLKKKEDGSFGGKIGKFYRSISGSDAASKLVDANNLKVYIMLYIATEQTKSHLENLLGMMLKNTKTSYLVLSANPLSPEICIKRGANTLIDSILDAYFDTDITDDHIAKGGTDGKYGFADCGLPLVLSHNSPNNSLFFLWAQTNKVRGLFPRVSRHR